MLQAVEAIIREGRIQPVEPISMEENARFLLIRLQPATSTVHRHPGSAKGRLSILKDDDDHLKDFTDYMA
jgi:hypothetical protein